MKKGQFFIISAVLIIVILYGINSVINQNIGIDYSEVQGRNEIWTIKEIEKSLEKTAKKNSNYSEELSNLVEQFKKDELLRDYLIEVKSAYIGIIQPVSISHKSEDAYLMYDAYFFPVVSDFCKELENDGYCDTADGDICLVIEEFNKMNGTSYPCPISPYYNVTCCSSYGDCC